MSRHITPADIAGMSTCPTWTKARINAVFARRGVTSASLLEIAGCGEVPLGDRLWLLLREEFIPARELRLLACQWAREQVAFASSRPMMIRIDPRSIKAIDVAERYANGDATDEELATAREDALAVVAMDPLRNRSEGWRAALTTDPSAGYAAARSAVHTTGDAALSARLADVRRVLQQLPGRDGQDGSSRVTRRSRNRPSMM